MEKELTLEAIDHLCQAAEAEVLVGSGGEEPAAALLRARVNPKGRGKGSQETLAALQNLALTLEEGDLPYLPDLDAELDLLHKFLTKVNEMPQFFDGCQFDVDYFVSRLFADYAHMLVHDIQWSEGGGHKYFNVGDMFLEYTLSLFRMCCWRSSTRQPTTSGGRKFVSFHWLLQQARRSGDSMLKDHYYNFWACGGAVWSRYLRTFRDNIAPHFCNLVEPRGRMLFRGSILSCDALDFFGERFHDGKGFQVHASLSTSMSRDVAMQFLDEERPTANKHRVLFEIIDGWNLTRFHQIDMRMMGEQELVVKGLRIDKVTAFHPVVTESGEEFYRIEIKLEGCNTRRSSASVCEWM